MGSIPFTTRQGRARCTGILSLAALSWAALAGGAAAQAGPGGGGGVSFGGAFSLGLSDYGGDDGLDGTAGTLDFGGTFSSGPVSLDMDLDATGTNDGEGLGIDSNRGVDVAARYQFSPALGAGTYIARDSIDFGGGDRQNLDSYGIEMFYDTPRWQTRLSIGETELDDAADDIDVIDYGLATRFDLQNGFTLFASGVLSRGDIGDTTFDSSAAGIGAAYAFGNGIEAFGSYHRTTSDDLDATLNSTSVGAAYTLYAAGQPVILSGEYTHLNGDTVGGASDGRRIAIGATIPLGDTSARKRLPGNTLTGNVLEGDRTATGGVLTGIGF
ncbi:hypothetical protein [Roseivivax isoporae]|uniref:Porin domain-containing protein n=1 Tax=Roseivivax isoporae LMG 25204 TaxID=1449351 RepID=X7F8Y7_9RHOB|nr:hypothetical protein [Roseivivax isoporae]ETX29285.1 hypothetical protein RISW2_01855 [Roseivivax isoporae LMG 25204]